MTARILKLDAVAERTGTSLPARPVASSVRERLGAAASVLVRWSRRSRQRAELRRVLERDVRFFQDIGISRATVYNEARKWFWQT